MKYRYKTVLFDLGNTLVSYYEKSDFHPVLKRCIAKSCQYLSQHGYCFDEIDSFERAKQIRRKDLAVYPLIARLEQLFAIDSSFAEKLCPIFMEPIFDMARVHDDSVSVLTSLKSKGICTGIVSNTPWGSPANLWRQELKRHGLYDLVDTTVFCADVGWRKPDSRIFQYALNTLNAAPETTLFVGDDPVWDVSGSREANITPILYFPNMTQNIFGDTAVVISRLSEVEKIIY